MLPYNKIHWSFREKYSVHPYKQLFGYISQQERRRYNGMNIKVTLYVHVCRQYICTFWLARWYKSLGKKWLCWVASKYWLGPILVKLLNFHVDICVHQCYLNAMYVGTPVGDCHIWWRGRRNVSMCVMCMCGVYWWCDGCLWFIAVNYACRAFP